MKRTFKKSAETRTAARITAALMLELYIAALCPFTAAAKPSSAVPPRTYAPEEKSESLIKAAEGGTVTLGKAHIEIPAGALKEDTEISITRLPKVESTGDSLCNAVPGSQGYRFLPKGTKFQKEAVITLPYSASLNSKPQALEDLYTYFYDTQKKAWIKLERLEVDTEQCIVRSLTTHFTDMINATLTLPESASPADVNLNSIKSLEAAKSGGHLITFIPPKGSSTGDASFSLELGIPSGRLGMQPQISVSYSSGGGNGIMGKGFDISYGSSVTTDTRLGLPDYDTHDTYMLDGILLEESERNGTTVTYTPQKETSFSRIRRYGAGTESDWWEVTGKNGTKKIYAQSPLSCTGSKARTFAWNLTRMQDVHGNTVVYTYEKQDGYVYPAAICYTGYKDTNGNYSVRFHYDEDRDTRQDIRIDARSREIISCRRLLTSVTTHYGSSSPIRTYSFAYTEGLAKENMMVSLSVSNNAGEHYEYTFDYIRPEKDGAGNVIYFAEAEEWKNGKPLHLGNSTSIGTNFNSAAGVGYGTDFIDARITGGASGSVSNGESYTQDTLIDIDGDGRPDSVRQNGNSISVALNKNDRFGEPQRITITKGSLHKDMDYETTVGSTVSWNVYTGVGATSIPLSLGTSYSEVRQNTSSSTLCSFMDMDRDGLVDIVESGKSTYLKNMGNLHFEERNIYTNVAVCDTTEPIDPELAEKYRKTYFVQTPFRMWKAPHNGIITITESAHGISGGFGANKTVIAKTYIGSNPADEQDLRMTVSSTGTSAAAKSDIAVKKGENYYFISDSGKEPEKTDISWNITAKYTDIKAFSPELEQPFLYLRAYQELIPEEKTCSLEAYKSFVTETYLGGSDALLHLFSFSKNGSYTSKMSAAYNPNWIEETTAQEQRAVTAALCEQNALIPAAYTEVQFADYLKSVRKSASESPETDKHYEKFALQFEYHAADSLYVLRPFASDEESASFFKTYPVPHSVQTQALSLYRKNGIDPTFTVSRTDYGIRANCEYGIRTGKTLDGTRNPGNIGTISAHSVSIGKYGSLGLYFDMQENRLNFSGKDSMSVAAPVPFEAIESALAEDSFSVKFGINKDKSGAFESVVSVSLSKASYRAENLSEAEFQKIIDDIPVNFTDAHDPHWQLKDTDDEAKRIKAEEIGSLFSDMKLTSEQKEQFIAAMYEQKDAFHTITTEQGEEQKELAYRYYVLKKDADFAAAQKILDIYKKETVIKEKFPFYTFSDGSYLLKSKWKTFKEKEAVCSEWLSEIRLQNPEVPDEKAEQLFEQQYQEYLASEELLKAECKKFRFGKYAEANIAQDFNTGHLYRIENDLYTIVLADGALNWHDTSFALQKAAWSSETDFSTENRSNEKIIYSYETAVDSEVITDTVTKDISIKSNETLYGGKDGWFYGVWKGSLDDVTFCEDALKEYRSELEDIDSEEKFEELENSVPDDLSNEQKEQQPEEKISFYLPQRQEDCELARDIMDFKNAAVTYRADLAESLLGTVTVDSVPVKTAEGRKTVREYYMPFIWGDTIHSDRAGGKSYYKIEGLNETDEPLPSVTDGSPLSMPSIRKSYTEGTDRTSVARLGFGKISEDPSKASNRNAVKNSYEIAISLPSEISPTGSNTSVSTAKQIIQDVNADGVPDIVQIDGSRLRITEGRKLNESGEICYDRTSEVQGIAYLSKNETDTKVYGGSRTASGSVQILPNANASGNIKSVNMHLQASANASGGITYSKGTSIQTHGISDINSDGLPDYYDGSRYALNDGCAFRTDCAEFSGIGSLSESKSQSAGMNFSLGLSADLSQANSLKSGASGTVGVTYSASSSSTEKTFTDINGDGLADILEMKPGSSVITVMYNTGSGFVQGQPVQLPGWKGFVTGNIEKFLTQSDSEGFDLGMIGDIPVIGTAVGKGLSRISINPFGFDADNLSNSLDWNTTVSLGLDGSFGANVNIGIKLFVLCIYIGTINITMSAGTGKSASTSISGASVKIMDLDGDGCPDHVLRIPGYGTYWKRNISGSYGLLRGIHLPQGASVQMEYAQQSGTPECPGSRNVLSRVTVHDGCGEQLPKIPHGEHSVTTRYEYDGGYYDRQKKDFYGFAQVRTTNADGTYTADEYYSREYYSKGVLKESRLHAADGTLLSRSSTALLPSPFALPQREESWSYEKQSGTESCIHTAAEYEYDGYGSCTRITQDYGGGEHLTAEISYDNTGAASYIVGLPAEIRVYGTDGELLRRRSGSYDGNGRLTQLRQHSGSQSHSAHTLAYDSYGNTASVTDSRGASLSYEYDSAEHMFVTGIARSGRGTDTYRSSFSYDAATQTKKSETDCNGSTLRYGYDSWQRLTEVFTSYDGAAPAVRYAYFTPAPDADGTHALWHTVTDCKVMFDADDDSVIQTVLQTDGLGRTVRTAKTGCVNGRSGWNTGGAAEYDAKGRTVREGMTEFTEGSMNDLLASVPKMTALHTSYGYDDRDRMIKTVLPDGSVQRTSYFIKDSRLVTQTSDPLGNVSVQEADSRGNIIRVARLDGSGRQLTEAAYTYNALGEMLAARDAKGHAVTAEYDLLGRRTALESPDSGRQEFFYDECSNIIRENNSVLRESSKQILYEYDGLNRLVRIDYPDTGDTVYTYGGANASNGAAGKILRVEDASGTLEYEYGRLGEVTKETRTLATHLNGYSPTETATMEYRSDYLGRMQHIVYPDGEKITYGYDAGGQVVSVTGTHWGHEFNYVTNILYDEYGQRTRIDYGNGTFTEYSYDPARRWLDTIKTENKWGQSFQNITYSFDKVGNVLGYENNCLGAASGNYKTRQTYSYDNLYQLIKVDGATTYNPYQSSVPEFISDYSQVFEFDPDGLGNMTSKVSTETVSPQKSIGDNLNYSFDYVYDENFAHRLVRAGGRHYQYDANGNVICEQDGDFESNGDDAAYHKITKEAEDVYSTDYGWGLFKDEDKSGRGASAARYRRTYTWDEKNRLISSVDSNYSTAYVYGQDGQRSNKYTQNSETLYFNKMWTLHTDSGNNIYGGQTAKNIYLGDTRIVTKLNSGHEPTYQEEYYKQYYYHSDHLGSATLISDYKGDEYQRIEYTPYGETWVEKTQNTGLEYLPYKFTGKEIDKETGLYYYGARYLDPRYSRWISTDPALGEYVSGSSAGEGGAYNSVNLNLYHYGNNNPVKYKDPDGSFVETAWDVFSLIAGAASFVADVKAGNVKGAVIDGLGIVADAAAVVLPCIPGGAGAAIKAARTVGGVANVTGGALSVQDGLENGNYIEAGLGAVQTISGTGQLFKTLSIGRKRCPVVTIDSSKYPETARHIKDAQVKGYPSNLTVNRPGAKSNRSESLKGYDKIHGKQLDEYPPAMFKEGGKGADIRAISPSDNMGAGASMGNQLRNVKDGTIIKIVVE